MVDYTNYCGAANQIMSVDCYRVLGESGRILTPENDVGINTLPDQLVSKKKKTGFNFNVMVVGEPGVGKSTLMETLFKIKMPESDPKDRTERLEIVTESIEEDNVTLDIKIISTQNYAQGIDKSSCIQQAVEYIDTAFDEYLDTEWTSPRRRNTDPDPRVHLCIYMLNPSGRSVRSVDLVAMKKLATKVNLVPVIAKADTVLPDVIEGFKDRITDDLCEYGVLYYEFPMEDDSMTEKNENYQNELPFAVCGSTTFIAVGGKKVRARQYPWGIVEIENEAHTQFNMLRDSIIRSNLAHLILATNDDHYAEYRRERMEEIGYTDNETDDAPVSLAMNVERQLTALDQQMSNVSKLSTESLMKRVNEKINEVKKREESIDTLYVPKIAQIKDTLSELEKEKMDIVTKMKERAAQQEEAGTSKRLKKKSQLFSKKN